MSFVLLTLPGLQNRPSRLEGPVWEGVRGSLVSVNWEAEEGFLCLKNIWSTSLPIRTHYGCLTGYTSASAEDRLNSHEQVSDKAYSTHHISVACATNL